MQELRKLEVEILAVGRVDSHHLHVLRQLTTGDGKKVDRQKADFLVELYKRVQHHDPAFEKFFYAALKNHILTDGKINAEETAWLRQMLLRDGKIQDEERKFLHEVKGEAKQTSPEFETLFAECMKQPQERHTAGG